MIGFEFLRPELFGLVGAALLVLLVGGWGLRQRGAELSRLVHASRLASFLPGHSRTRGLARLLLATGALVFLGISAAGPVRGYTT